MKKIVSILLIVSMILTTGGFSALADSVSDGVETTQNENIDETELSHKSLDDVVETSSDEEAVEEKINDSVLATISDIDEEDEENYTGEYEEEMEDDETITVESSEEESEEVVTASESNLVDEDGIESSPDIKDDVEEIVTSISATKSEIISDIVESSESEINQETTLPLLSEAPLFGDAAPVTIWLGTYPQSATWQSDGSAYNIVEPIQWRKLSESGTEALYVADKILDNVSYHAAGGSITWGTSGIHTWLNDTSADGFIGKAFTTNQLDDADGIVLEKTITTTDSADTNDKAFLLSVDDVQNLITPASSRRIYGTEYAKTKVNGGPTLEVDSGHSPWWLRSPGNAGSNYAVHVRASGIIVTDGASVNSQTTGARPAIYINLSSPLYKTSDNAVSWDLNGGSLANGSALWSSMNTYFGGQLLPTANNFTAPAGKHFIGMQLNTAAKSSVNTIIPDNQEGNITLRPIFGDTATDKVINYNFGTGTLTNWSLLPKNYTVGTAKPLPSRNDIETYITAPAGQEFKGFAKSGTTDLITEIASSENDNIDLVAIYGDIPAPTPTPTPDPEPYNPGGRGGSSGGGGGGGGGRAMNVSITTTNLNQVKTIKAAVDSSQVSWSYDPITNKFKMNVAVGAETVPAADGFYLVNSIVEQNVNGVIARVPVADTYYFNNEGTMITGWIKTNDNKWYYMESMKNANEGKMMYGWHQVENKWYYFVADGMMLVNALTPDGFTVGADGVWIQNALVA